MIGIQAYLREQENSQIKNLVVHQKEPQKAQTKPKISRRRQMIKIRVDINEIETAKNRKRSVRVRAGS